MVRRAALDRFAAKWAEDEHGCHVWTACRLRDGYGRFFVEGRSQLAHRWLYEATHGRLPSATALDHLCRNRACVNLAHLEPVTWRENTLRGETIPAANLQKTCCPNGHAYDNGNTYRDPSGRRHCRKCQAERERESTR